MIKKILITGAGGSPAVNFTRSLRSAEKKNGEKRYYIVGTDCDKYYLMRAEVDEHFLVPGCNDDLYIPVLKKIIRDTGCEFLHVQNDAEMAVISAHRDELGVKTFLPSKETIRICHDKMLSYDCWKKAGIRQPMTMMIHNEEDLRDALQQWGKIWIRDTTGAGGRGSLPTTDFKVAKSWLDFKEGWGKYTAAECLTEDSITWMSLWNRGELIVAQGRKRLYWELSKISPSGITGATGTGVTCSDPLLDDIAQKAIFAIDKEPHGIFSVDMTYDHQGIPNPTEINIGRFFTTHEFFTRAGLNMPEMLVSLAYDEPLQELDRKISPLTNNLAWIRGMDFTPVLTDLKEVERHVQRLENLKKEIR